jgi:hypothetical protein
MVEAQMKTLVRLGHKPHKIDTKKYGQPKLALYWADRRTFSCPGLYLWDGKTNRRILRLPRRSR